MWEKLQNYSWELALGGLGSLLLLAAGRFIIRRFPRGQEPDTPTTSDMMSTFRDLHSQGELSDEEYRTIKTKLAARLKDELSKDDEEPDFTEFKH